MSVKNLREFMDKISKDESLKAKLEQRQKEFLDGATQQTEMTEEMFEKVVKPISEEAGFDFSWKDFQDYSDNPIEGELLDDELEAAVGGVTMQGKACACVIGGSGHYDVVLTDADVAKLAKRGYIVKDNGVRHVDCSCFGGGGGGAGVEYRGLDKIGGCVCPLAGGGSSG